MLHYIASTLHIFKYYTFLFRLRMTKGRPIKCWGGGLEIGDWGGGHSWRKDKAKISRLSLIGFLSIEKENQTDLKKKNVLDVTMKKVNEWSNNFTELSFTHQNTREMLRCFSIFIQTIASTYWDRQNFYYWTG